MTIKEKYAKIILDELYKNGEISEEEYETLYNNYTERKLRLIPVAQEGMSNSETLSQCMLEAALDIAALFDELNDTDDVITRHRKLNEAVLNSIKLELNKSYDKIVEYEQRIRNKNHFVRYEAFRDPAGIEKDKSYYQHDNAYYDKYLEAIKLRYIDSANILVSKSGTRLGKIEITRQHGQLLSSIKNNQNKLENAIDTDMSTYWHEVIAVDSPIEIPYKDVKRGAVCELLITFDLISEINEITLTPFGEFPLQIVSISYSDSDDGEFYPVVYRLNNDIYHRNKESEGTMHYQFGDLKAKRIKLLLNQQHYVINHFVAASENVKANGIFITEDKEGLSETLLKPVRKAIMNNSFNIDFTNRYFYNEKLQYEYGLYNILIARNEFAKVSQFVTTPSRLPKSATMILVTDEEHYLEDGILQTSIEYELVGPGVPGGRKPILPWTKNSVDMELLNPIYDAVNNRIIAKLRFPADISTINVYQDNVLITGGYSILNQEYIELSNYNAQSNYCVNYTPADLTAAKEIKLTADGDVRISAVLRQNSRKYTGVTPILKSYMFIAKDLPLDFGDDNELVSLRIIPDMTYISLNTKSMITTSGTPVLAEIIPNISSVTITEGDYIELEDYSEVTGDE